MDGQNIYNDIVIQVNEIRQENQKEGRKRRAAMKGVQQARERKRLRIDG